MASVFGSDTEGVATARGVKRLRNCSTRTGSELQALEFAKADGGGPLPAAPEATRVHKKLQVMRGSIEVTATNLSHPR